MHICMFGATCMFMSVCAYVRKRDSLLVDNVSMQMESARSQSPTTDICIIRVCMSIAHARM